MRDKIMSALFWAFALPVVMWLVVMVFVQGFIWGTTLLRDMGVNENDAILAAFLTFLFMVAGAISGWHRR